MNLSNLEFFVTEAWLSIKRNLVMSMLALFTITISLVILGSFLFFISNINNIVSTITSRLEIMVYLEDDITPVSIQRLQVDVGRLKEVRSVRFISKDIAWQGFREKFAGSIDFSGLLQRNPLPHAFRVRVSRLDRIPFVADVIRGFPGVDDVRFGGQLLEKVQAFSSTMQISGIVILIFLGLATLLIVVNTIRLTVLSRQDEIWVMQLVGATSSFIKWPFIIEGVFLGFTGGLVAIIVVSWMYGFFVVRFQQALPFLPLMTNNSIFHPVYPSILITGIVLGTLGGYISVTRSLKN